MTDENKQIEEMAEIICENYNDGRCLVDGFNCMEGTCERREHIEKLISTGYRKETETIAEFKELVKEYLLDKGLYLNAVKNAMEYAEKKMKGE
jgi:hypothetical protein